MLPAALCHHERQCGTGQAQRTLQVEVEQGGSHLGRGVLCGCVLAGACSGDAGGRGSLAGWARAVHTCMTSSKQQVQAALSSATVGVVVEAVSLACVVHHVIHPCAVECRECHLGRRLQPSAAARQREEAASVSTVGMNSEAVTRADLSTFDLAWCSQV